MCVYYCRVQVISVGQPSTARETARQQEVRPENGRKRERESGIGRRAKREFRAGGGRRWREQAAEARRGRHSGRRRAQEAAQCLSAPAPKEQVQGAPAGGHAPVTARCARLVRYRFSARREQVPPRGADVRAAQLREVHDAGEEEAVRVEAPRHALCVFNKATSITLHNTP